MSEWCDLCSPLCAGVERCQCNSLFFKLVGDFKRDPGAKAVPEQSNWLTKTEGDNS